jgi:homoserine O-acetyltransferase
LNNNAIKREEMAIFCAPALILKNGVTLSDVEIAYEYYGELNEEKSNAILITHGTTSSHIAAGTVTLDRRKGWWNEVIGPGLLFDTTKYCMISTNVLGSSYGSTGPASINPAIGKPYGTDFPEICLEDIAQAQHLLLKSFGIEKLVAVAGASIGGFQAFQWAVTFPDYMSGIIALDTAPKDIVETGSSLNNLLSDLSTDPSWNNGNYYATGGMEDKLTELRINTLKSYGIEEKLDDTMNEVEREKVITDTAREWAREFDTNSLITQMRAVASFDVESVLDKIQAKVLYILCDTDEWFPSSIGKEVTSKLIDAGIDARFLEVHSRYGHYATIEEPEKWVPEAKCFLKSLST